MAVWVCTFASGAYAGSAAALRYSALTTGGADGVVVYGERDVEPWFREHPDLDPRAAGAGAARGHGWWSWKPWVIRDMLSRVAPGDAVVYCDAAVLFEAPAAPLAALATDERPVALFRLGGWDRHGYVNRRWTKPDALEAMGASEAARAAPQLNAAIQVYRHTPEALAFLDEYARWCGQREVVDDAHRRARPGPEFVDHRHDQSVLSVLAAGHPAVRLARDPTQYGVEDEDQEGLVVPRTFDHHRRRLNPVKIAVITPTVGTRHLAACVRSVQAQRLPNVAHYVVVDGPEHSAAVAEALKPHADPRTQVVPIHVLTLPHNVGAGGWNGHRCFGAMPWLVDADYVAFLDEDNEMDPDHLPALARAVVAQGAPWGYSLRRIVGPSGEAVCADNCESLGGLCHTVCGPGDRLVDTSCYLIDRRLAIEVSPHWNHKARAGLEVDREVCKALLSVHPGACSRRHSIAYRTGSTASSVRPEFFVRGNARMGYDFARFPDLYVFHFSPEVTARFLACRRKTDRSYALDEWQMTLLRGLDGLPGGGSSGLPGGPERFNLLDGYACLPHIPRGATCLVSMCHPHEVPWDFLASRPDVWRVCYTLESPNIRHAAQWDPTVLAKHFDRVLTYWRPLLDDPRVATVFCPHNTHHLDFGNPLDAAQLRANRGTGRSCVMVLERRDLSGTYVVPNAGVTLRCLDQMRELLVRDLRDVTVFGVGWDAAAKRNPGLKVGHALHRSRDPRHAVDIIQDHTFAIIVENCDAEGYASEKLYDALLAGAIPLYYGSVPPELGVPEGPEAGLYLDLKRVVGPPGRLVEHPSRAVQAFIDGLSDEAVAAWKRRIAEQRETVLRKVDVASFAAAAARALARA